MMPTVIIACVFFHEGTGRYYPASFKGVLYDSDASCETKQEVLYERNYFHTVGFKKFSQALNFLSPTYEYAKVYKKARKWSGPEVAPKYLKLIKGKSVTVISHLS